MPLFIILAGVVLALPSLGAGWAADDHHIRLRLEGGGGLPGFDSSPLDLFRFSGRTEEETRELIDTGLWPWWTIPQVRAAFFRPITSATHWLDHVLWRRSAVLQHLHSLLWFGLLLAALAALYRRLMGPTLIAGLAALLFAIDDARVMPTAWIANRNALLAGVLGILALLAHDRWRRDGRMIGAVGGPLLLAAALLSKEEGIAACGYLFAYALFLDRGRVVRRFAALLPYAAVVVIWRIGWSAAGYGVTVGTEGYVDPVGEPLRYAIAVVERAPMLLAAQFFLPPADFYPFTSDYGIQTVYWIAGAAVFLAVALLIVPRIEWTPLNRFWAVGMLLALMPACAGLIGDRLLGYVAVGACPLLADFLIGTLSHRSGDPEAPPRARPGRLIRIAAVVLVVVHLGIAPVALAVRSAMPVGPPDLVERLQVSVSPEVDLEGKMVVVVTSPLPLAAGYLPERRALADLSLPKYTRVLAPFDASGVEVTRPDAHTLIVRPAGGFLNNTFDRLGRSDRYPLAVGDRIELAGMTAEVLTVNEANRPAEVAFRFDKPLKDPSFVWLHWMDGRHRAFAVPAVD